MVKNLIEAWPDEVYTEPLVEARLLGRNTTFVCAPDLIHELLVTQAEALERDDFVLRALTPALGQGVLTTDGATWRHQRRMAAPAFRHDQIDSFIPAMNAAAARTRERWLAGRHDLPFDVLGEMMATALDVICATMLSTEAASDVAMFGQAMNDYLEQTTWKIALTFLGAPAWMPHPGSVRAARAVTFLRGAVAGIVARRRASKDNGTDLLGLLLEARDPETAAPMSDTALVDNLLTFVAAGHETTALVMAWTFQLLAEHPEIDARVVGEIASARRPDGDMDLASLTYTRQVLMEVMRLYPPAPMLARRTARAITLGNFKIPAGRSIQVPVYAVHRHKARWPAPGVFDPSRFAEGAMPHRPRYSYLPFGAGPRVCIGASFAMTECLAFVAGLLPEFRFAPATPQRPEARFKTTLRPHGGVSLFVTPRRGLGACRAPGGHPTCT